MSPHRPRILPVAAVLLVTAGAVWAGSPDGDVLVSLSAPGTSRAGFRFDVGVFTGNFHTTPSPDNQVAIAASAGLVIQSITPSAGTAMVLSPSQAVWNVALDSSTFEFATVTVQAQTEGTQDLTTTITPNGINDINPLDNASVSIVTVGRTPDQNSDPGTQTDYGHPVSAFSGGFHMTEPHDLNLGGPGPPIFFQRHYDSKLLDDGEVQSALGPNWQHNYDLSLSTSGTNATAVFREGRILRFENDGADWNIIFRADIPFQLVETGGEFLLADPRSQFMYFFDTNGLLARIEDGRGNTNSLSYDGTLLTNVTDNLNRTLSFLYDTNDLFTSVSDGQRTVGFGHTGSNLTSFVNALGETYTYAYDPANTNNPALMTSHTSPEGNTPITSVFDAEGRVTRQTNGVGNTSAMAYDLTTAGRVHTYTNALGGTQIHVHNENGELSRLTDEAGNSISVQSDAAGRRNRVTDRRGRLTQITYNNTSGLPTKIDLQASPNLDEFFFYSPRTVSGIEFFDLTRSVHADNSTDSYVYDGSGNLIRSTNRVGHVSGYGYNSRGQVLTATNPVGGELTFTYDGNARLVSAADSDVGATTYEYDSLHRLTNVTHPNPDTIRFAWDALNRITSVTDALNQTTRFEYDAMDRPVRAVDRLGNAATFGYDPRTDPSSFPAAVTNRNGFSTRFEYDERRFLTGVVDPAGKTNSFGYDLEGSILSAGNPLGETFSFQRDPMGYVIGITDPLGNNVGVLRDNMKRVTLLTDPLGRKTNYGYDPRGLLTSAACELAISGAYQYSPLGLITNLVDPKSSPWTFAYTPMGRLADFNDPLARQTLYEYDARGRRSRITYPDGITRTNTYDGANNLTQAAWSDGTIFQFAYDPVERLTNAVGQASSLSLSYDAENRVTNTRQAGLDFGAGYDAGGRLTGVSYSNGLFSVTYAYDSRDRLIHVSDSLTGQGMGFNYDDANRLTGVTRSNGVNGAYTYDARGFLTRIQEGSVLDIQYTLDAAGQVTEVDYVTAPIDPLSALTNELLNFSYDAASQINSAGYQYDPRGRLTNAPNTSFTWDGASRLRAIDPSTGSGQAAAFTYNALSDLETRAEGGATNRYFYNYAVGLAPIMAERDEDTGQFTRFYIWSPGGRLLYIVAVPGNIAYLHFDRIGSTMALTDGAGLVTDAYAYNPYGRLLSQTGLSTQPFRFAGRYGARDEPAGNLIHMRDRYLSPLTARFLSRDRAWPFLDDARELNPYGYVQQNPVGLIDPIGRSAIFDLASGLANVEVVMQIIFRILDPLARNGGSAGSVGDSSEQVAPAGALATVGAVTIGLSPSGGTDAAQPNLLLLADRVQQIRQAIAAGQPVLPGQGAAAYRLSPNVAVPETPISRQQGNRAVTGGDDVAASGMQKQGITFSFRNSDWNSDFGPPPEINLTGPLTFRPFRGRNSGGIGGSAGSRSQGGAYVNRGNLIDDLVTDSLIEPDPPAWLGESTWTQPGLKPKVENLSVPQEGPSGDFVTVEGGIQ